MSLRILTVADVPSDPNKGAAGTEVRTAEALRSIGHRVDSIWAPDLGRRIRHGNLHVLLELPRAYERAIVDALSRASYDVVHVNQPHGFRAARAVHRIAPHSVFVHRSHGLELNVNKTLEPWRKTFEGDKRSVLRRGASSLIAQLLARHSFAIAREADGHIVSSTLDAEFLANALHVDRMKIGVIPQAAPDVFFEEPAPPVSPERLKKVLYVGQFSFVKAPIIAAEAMNRLAMTRRDVTFTWVCDRKHHSNVRMLLSDKANAQIQLLHWMPQNELRHIYDLCGIFVFPSFFEGFGKAFLEAMARGMCVVASDVGGMHDVIEHGRTGMLIQPGNAEAMATATLELIDSPQRAATMGAAAADAARAYTWERVGRQTADFYHALLMRR